MAVSVVRADSSSFTVKTYGYRGEYRVNFLAIGVAPWLQFPNNPGVGEIHVEGGAAYIWDGTKWKAIGQDVLQRSANLADVPDPAAALANLGGLPGTNPVVQGTLSATDEISGPILRTSHRPNGPGSVAIQGADPDHTGIVAFFEGADDTVRVGYVGYAAKATKQIMLQAEQGYSWRFDGNPYVYNGASVWGNDGNLYGSAWGGWLSNYLGSKAGVNGEGASNFYVQGNAWSNNRVLLGWNGAGYLNAQVDAVYLGRVITDANFMNFFSFRRTGGGYTGRFTIPGSGGCAVPWDCAHGAVSDRSAASRSATRTCNGTGTASGTPRADGGRCDRTNSERLPDHRAFPAL